MTEMLAQQNSILEVACSDCEKSKTKCALCHEPICSTHRRKVLRYLPKGIAPMCEQCKAEFLHYDREVVNPRYPA